MKRELQGYYTRASTVGGSLMAFVPASLPPDPPIDWTLELRSKFDQALLALGRLDSVSMLLPDTSLFLYMYIRKEALLSSMIEGTQSSLSDLLLFELGQEQGAPLHDVQEVSRYVAALSHGLKRLDEGFSPSLRLIKELHAVLLTNGQGSQLTPGEFRNSQNWIGGTRPGNAAFLPPPPDKIMECLCKLELFLHDQPGPTPILLKAALAHVQFETIRPFRYGNGRMGRLLMTLLLCSEGVLREPMLFLSLYFKTHCHSYFELLNNVHLNGDWEAWLEFFADAVIATATQAVETAKQLLDLSSQDRLKIMELGRPAASILKVHRVLTERPIATSGLLVEKTGISDATVNKALEHLGCLGIVRELTSMNRNCLFSYSRYLDILNQGMELPDAE
ncbi:MAG: Fic family protein [Chlorobiaceae bacterium]|jgi:Fic family protein